MAHQISAGEKKKEKSWISYLEGVCLPARGGVRLEKRGVSCVLFFFFFPQKQFWVVSLAKLDTDEQTAGLPEHNLAALPLVAFKRSYLVEVKYSRRRHKARDTALEGIVPPLENSPIAMTPIVE